MSTTVKCPIEANQQIDITHLFRNHTWKLVKDGERRGWVGRGEERERERERESGERERMGNERE